MTSKFFSLALSVGLGASTLAGCGSPFSTAPSSDEGHHVHVAPILKDSTTSASDKAERLARAAEQLLTVQGFAYASDVADLALAQDPKNLRALFLKAVLGPIMAEKGIVARVQPLAAKSVQSQNAYDESVAELEQNYPNSSVKSFLLEGSGDIASEQDLQNYVDSVTTALDNLRLFAKNNKDQSLTIMTTDSMYPFMQGRFNEACWVSMPYWGEYEWQCPSPVHSLEISLNRGDFEGIEQFAAGLELYFKLYNSYDISGAFQVAVNHAPAPGGPLQLPSSAQDILNELIANPKFATLRQNNGFQKIKEMGIDAVAGVRWIMDHQDSLCPLGSEDPRNRLGALFNEGMCTDKKSAVETATALRKIDGALAGGVISLPVYQNGVTYNLVLRPSAMFESPIADLRTLMPLQSNSCGDLIGIADTSVGGLLPHHDADTLLMLGSQCPY